MDLRRIAAHPNHEWTALVGIDPGFNRAYRNLGLIRAPDSCNCEYADDNVSLYRNAR